MKKLLQVGLASLVVMSGYQFPAFAVGSGGLQNITAVTTRSMGTGYTFAGVADDASAIYFNPAGLTQVKGADLILGGTYISFQSEHTASKDTSAAVVGQKDKLGNNLPVSGFLYASYSKKDTPWAFGIGINSPFGLVSDWKDTSFSKYYATNSKLLMYNVNPTMAYSVNEKVSVGLGVDYFDIYKTELNRKVLNSLGGAAYPDGDAKLQGTGHAWGYNTAVLYKVNDQHSLGLSYRSQANVILNGSLEITNLNPTPLGLGGYGISSFKTGASTEFKLPQSVLLGYGYRPTDKWTLSVDYDWVDWRCVNETKFNYEGTAPVGPLGGLLQADKIDRNWKATNNIGAGAEWKAKDWLSLRGGLFAYERVIPSGSVEASLPESSRWGITLGSGFKLASTSIDLGYNFIKYNSRSINNNQEDTSVFNLYSQDGKFKTTAHAFSLSVSQKWGGI